MSPDLLHFADDLDAADAVEVTRRVVPFEEPGTGNQALNISSVDL